jgi:glycosyltransferase involved in cell wall biosynthesis
LSDRPLSFFIQDLREGGAERNVARLLNGIVARGVPTDLVVIRRRGAFFEELDPRVNVVELAQRRTLASVLALKRYIERRRPLALVSSLTHTNIAAILANTAASRRTKVIVVERNQFTLNRGLKRGTVKLSYLMVPWLYPKADLVAGVSEGVRDDLARATGIPASRIAVLYNPVVSDAIEKSAGAPVEHPWLHEPGTPVVLGVGRFTRQKNFALLLNAFAAVRSRRRARLIVLGDGELRKDLEDLSRALGIAGDVDLPGFDANPFRFMRRAGVFVLSSDWEGLPTALIEAMACGAPVVSTDCDAGPKEILLGGRLGRIVRKGDIDGLAGAISATLDAPGDQAATVARAREFSLDRAVDRYLQVTGWQ